MILSCEITELTKLTYGKINQKNPEQCWPMKQDNWGDGKVLHLRSQF